MMSPSPRRLTSCNARMGVLSRPQTAVRSRRGIPGGAERRTRQSSMLAADEDGVCLIWAGGASQPPGRHISWRPLPPTSPPWPGVFGLSTGRDPWSRRRRPFVPPWSGAPAGGWEEKRLARIDTVTQPSRVIPDGATPVVLLATVVWRMMPMRLWTPVCAVLLP